MSTPQKIAQALLPTAWFDAIRVSSERWMIQCPHCQTERSVWSVGGLRWGAISYGKRVAAHCSKCDKVVAAKLRYRDVENVSSTGIE
ncbi:hypothetical protein Rcae01_00003 [Novipirellula caenicola]|uniref:Uncharacterized protein n=1 Tax=Novipirellula caenicola TaxID=1536901 RepID=A0ABP9VH69_9BACT